MLMRSNLGCGYSRLSDMGDEVGGAGGGGGGGMDAELSSRDAKGIGLCLSGGGYRAMLFHVGTLWRLNEAGILPKISIVSSVSGGSITAGVLGMNWGRLGFDSATGVASQFQEMVVEPLRAFSERTVDASSIIAGIALPGSIADRVVSAYKKYLFGERTLADLPKDQDGPRFIINATNVMSGVLWRFSRPYMGDYRVGLVREPKVALAVAVAASSAFPPVLSPLTLELDRDKVEKQPSADLHMAPYIDTAVLSDGGVYDNLGMEAAMKRCKTLLVSDAGQKMSPEEEPDHDWARHAKRILDVVDNQVRSLRKRQLIQSYLDKSTLGRTGAYWSIRSDFASYARDKPGLADPMNIANVDGTPQATVPTRLKAMNRVEQQKLINWGYAICDAALRCHAAAGLSEYGIDVGSPKGWPYPQAAL